VLYRQHDRNTVGARGWPQVCREGLRRPLVWWQESGARFDGAVRQARELDRRLADGSGTRPGSPAPAALREFSQAFGRDVGALRRLRTVRRYGIRPRTLLPYPVFFYLRALLWSPARATGHRQAAAAAAEPWGTPGRAIFDAKDGPA
jgi:hypothetical protein